MIFSCGSYCNLGLLVFKYKHDKTIHAFYTLLEDETQGRAGYSLERLEESSSDGLESHSNY